jgi:hypothetical protein
LLGTGCSENIEPGTRRASICDSLGFYSSDTWVVLAFAPLVVFAGLMFYRRTRAPPWRTAALVLLATVVVDVALLAAIS